MSFGIKNDFTKGIVDTDSALQYVDPGSVIKANNVDIFQQGDNGVVKSIKGNVYKGGRINEGDYCVGHATWESKIYLLYTTNISGKNYWREYDIPTDVWTLVCENDLEVPTDLPDNSVLGVSSDVLGGDFIYWTLFKKLSDGSLEGIGEPKRLHIKDAKSDPYIYSNFSGNMDKPDKLVITGVVDPSVKENNLKYNSFIFYKRYTNKYNEQTILSYPSNNISAARGEDLLYISNRIDIHGFTVEDNINTVDILMSNDSSGTFSIIKTIDTTINKSVEDISFFNDYDYPILDAYSSDVVTNEFPLTATEQEIVDNRIVYGDVNIYRKFEYIDENGIFKKIDKNKPFQYDTLGIGKGSSTIFDERMDTPYSIMNVNCSFIDGKRYSLKFKSSWSDTTIAYRPLYYPTEVVFDYIYFNGDDYIKAINDVILNVVNLGLVVSDYPGGTGTHNFTLQYTETGNPNFWFMTRGDEFLHKEEGLNIDFRYKGGIVFLDEKGRNNGVSNITEIIPKSDIEEYIFDTSTNIGNSDITPPWWATKYMIVRDKINTNLSYSSLYYVGTSLAVPGVTIYQIHTVFYTDYIGDDIGIAVSSDAPTTNDEADSIVYLNRGTNAGTSISGYLKEENKQMLIYIMSDSEIEEENDYRRLADLGVLSLEHVFASLPTNEELPEGNNVLLYQPNAEIESLSEVFSETSNIFDVTRNFDGVFQFSGDGKKLDWYDTKIAVFLRTKWSYIGIDTEIATDVPIMKVDTSTLRDINHLGRGAYISLKEVNMLTYATMVHSQNYSPSTNYNGVNAFSSLYNNFKDMETKHGRILKLQYDETDLIVIQERKWNKMLINKSLLTSSSGTGVIEKSKSFFNDIVPYPGEYGISDKDSFVSHGFRRYGVDARNGVILRLSGDGFTVINGTRNRELRDLMKGLSANSDILGGFDSVKEEYVIVFVEARRIFRFSEAVKGQAGEYSWGSIPSNIITIEDSMYTVNELDQSIYEEGVGIDGKIYGEDVDNEISIVVNKDPDKIKQYLAVSTQSNIPLDVIFSTDKNITDVDNSEFKEREDVFYTDIPKSSKSGDEAVFGVGTVKAIVTNVSIELESNGTNIRIGDKVFTGATEIATVVGFDKTLVYISDTSNVAVGDFIYTKRSSKIEGEALKGNYCKIDLTNSSGEELTLKGINTQINLSSHV